VSQVRVTQAEERECPERWRLAQEVTFRRESGVIAEASLAQRLRDLREPSDSRRGGGSQL